VLATPATFFFGSLTVPCCLVDFADVGAVLPRVDSVSAGDPLSFDSVDVLVPPSFVRRPCRIRMALVVSGPCFAASVLTPALPCSGLFSLPGAHDSDVYTDVDLVTAVEVVVFPRVASRDALVSFTGDRLRDLLVDEACSLGRSCAAC